MLDLVLTLLNFMEDIVTQGKKDNYVCICACICVCICLCVCMCMVVYVYICMFVYVYMYVCMYVCIYICMYMYVCRDRSSLPILGGGTAFFEAFSRHFCGVSSRFGAVSHCFRGVYRCFETNVDTLHCIKQHLSFFSVI